ncbi:uncharacterized protein LOC126836677 [Adelges cooleyi]|uniref:uncharacterized protein LOC126836677 n=1 Tax=Adelges cooleyi TaxID=133065 RepID=UPI00217FDE1E|nr:uncharacterized protein LOC126836677 [Adelges cooleyi]
MFFRCTKFSTSSSETMICKTIIICLLCFTVSVNALLGLGNSSVQRIPKWKLATDLEEVFEDKQFVRLLSSMDTLDYDYIIEIGEEDVELLSKECHTDDGCLEEKSKSVKKYHSKVQGLQCVNAIIIESFWTQVEGLRRELGTDLPRELFQTKVTDHMSVLTHMLSVMYLAKWAPQPWQIKTLTFFTGLVSPDLVGNFLRKFKEAHAQVEAQLDAYIAKCRLDGYLHTSRLYSSDNIPDFYAGNLFANSVKFEYAYNKAHLFTVENLMLSHLHRGGNGGGGGGGVEDLMDIDMLDPSSVQDQGYQGGPFGAGPLVQFGVEWSRTNSRLLKLEKLIGGKEHQTWLMNPVENRDYHVLLLKCVRLRLMYHAWLHAAVFCAVKSGSVALEERLPQSWSRLEGPLKHAVRFLVPRHCDPFWILLRAMMDDFDHLDAVELQFIEGLMRIHLVEAVGNLGVGDKQQVDVGLQTIFTRENYKTNIEGVVAANVQQLQAYTESLTQVFGPLNGTFISMYANHDTWYTRAEFKSLKE